MVHVCTDYCEDMHCRARARREGALDDEDGAESPPQQEFGSPFASPFAEPLAQSDTPPTPQQLTATLVEDFVLVLSRPRLRPRPEIMLYSNILN